MYCYDIAANVSPSADVYVTNVAHMISGPLTESPWNHTYPSDQGVYTSVMPDDLLLRVSIFWVVYDAGSNDRTLRVGGFQVHGVDIDRPSFRISSKFGSAAPPVAYTGNGYRPFLFSFE